MKNEPPLDAKCRDKFLVQSVAVTAEKEFTNITQIVGFFFSRGHDSELLTAASGSMLMRPRNHQFKRRRSELCICQQKELEQQLHL